MPKVCGGRGSGDVRKTTQKETLVAQQSSEQSTAERWILRFGEEGEGTLDHLAGLLSRSVPVDFTSKTLQSTPFCMELVCKHVISTPLNAVLKLFEISQHH